MILLLERSARSLNNAKLGPAQLASSSHLVKPMKLAKTPSAAEEQAKPRARTPKKNRMQDLTMSKGRCEA